MINSQIDSDLKLLEEAAQYQKWIYSLIEPFVGKRVLELGAGIGSYTEKLAADRFLVATDIDPYFVKHIKHRFVDMCEISAEQLDLRNISEKQKDALKNKRFDTIVLLNVLEHIEDDLCVLKQLKDCLSDSGCIIVTVPAFQVLYGSLDSVYGHFRRYSKKDFENMNNCLGMKLIKCNYFNLLGFFGWYFSAKLCKKKYMSRNLTILFDKIAPFLRRIEEIVNPPVGLSILAVFSKE